MNFNHPPLKNTLSNFNCLKTVLPASIHRIEFAAPEQRLIRFEEKKDRYIWANPDEIIFVKSADHYVKSLIKCGREKKWMTRHSTLKELLDILPEDNFIRLNKFYVLNLNYFSYINENEKIIYFKEDFSIPVPHRISPYLRHLLKTPVREMHFTK
jgi:DNA-binding LytR/AlgR family response regulator